MRIGVSDVLDLLALACLAVFAWMLWHPAVLVVAALALMLIGLVMDRRGGES